MATPIPRVKKTKRKPKSESRPQKTKRETYADVLAAAHAFADRNRRALASLDQLKARVIRVFGLEVHESVERAAGHLKETLFQEISTHQWRLQVLDTAINAVEGGKSLFSVVKEQESFLLVVKSELIRFKRPADLADLSAAVDALEYAAVTNRNDELQKVSRAMERVLGAVTELRQIGFAVGELQMLIDEFITEKTKVDSVAEFSLLAPVVSSEQSKGTKRNNRMAKKKRARLLEKDKWIRGFLNRFWYKYWRNAFEQSISREEEEPNIVCALQAIPRVLRSAKRPLSIYELCSEVWRDVESVQRVDRANLSRMRFYETHIFLALDRLLHGATPAASEIVRVGGDEPLFWTRKLAENERLEILPPELGLRIRK